MRSRIRMLSLALSLVLSGAACAQDGDPTMGASPIPGADGVSLRLGQVPVSVEGNVVEIPVALTGFEVVAPDGDTSGRTGHFHVFVDRDPVAVGQEIPREAGIVHSAENPIRLYGLPVGEHTFTVVLGDGAHNRVHEDAEGSVTVEVKGPSVRATAPATVPSGEDLTIEVEAEGVEIRAADGDTSGASGHFHVLIDPESPPEAGATIPPAEERKIIHTAESSVTVSGLAAGQHVIWVVLGDGTHAAFDPMVAARLMVTVEE